MIDDTSFETHRQQDAKDQIRQLGRIIVEQHDEVVAMAKLAVLLKVDIAEKDAEIERLNELLTRAADALEKYTSYPIGMAMSVTLRETGRAVLDELRKAAE